MFLATQFHFFFQRQREELLALFKYPVEQLFFYPSIHKVEEPILFACLKQKVFFRGFERKPFICIKKNKTLIFLRLLEIFNKAKGRSSKFVNAIDDENLNIEVKGYNCIVIEDHRRRKRRREMMK